MNKLHNALKTLNLTLEQRNELVKVLGELGGGGNNNDKVFKLEASAETDDMIIKINGTNINYTNGDEGSYGNVCYIDENTFNFIKDVMIDSTIFEVVSAYGTSRMKALVLYKEMADEFECGLYIHFDYVTEISRFFTLSKVGSRCFFSIAMQPKY